MTCQTKQAVALGMATLWLLLAVIGFSDEFAALQDTPSKSHPTVHQIVQSDPVVYISDDVPAVPTVVESDGPTTGGDVRPPRQDFMTPFMPDQPPPRGGTKLFQLLSTYRI